MSRSAIVKSLLHKLSKNELLQNGGRNAKHYRNKLNTMYGSGKDEDDMTDEILKNLDQLIPLSVLEQYVNDSELKMKNLSEEKTKLEADIAKLKEDSATHATSHDEKDKKIFDLETLLKNVQDQITALTAELATKEKELTIKQTEIATLIVNINKIRNRVDIVKGKTMTSETVQTLLAKLRGETPAAPVTET